MLGIDQSILDSCTGSSLKTIISNAAALPQSLKEKIVEHFGEDCFMSAMVQQRVELFQTLSQKIN